MVPLKYTLLALSLAVSPAYAANVTWATINAPVNGVVNGNIGGVTFTYTGEISFVDASNTGATNYFIPTSTYTSSTVSNAPSDGGMIAINGTPGTTHVFTFSTPVTDLIFSEVSMGQPGIATTYNFNNQFTVLSCGPNAFFGGGCFNQPVGTTTNILSGNEADGTIEFLGPITTLSFTASNPEFWNGFDIGLLSQTTTNVTPEPGTFVLAGTGLAGLLGIVRRRFKV